MSMKDVKRDYLISTALALFLDRGPGEVTLKEVASAAGAGEATVYRYFSHKQNLVSAAAEKLQSSVFDEYFSALGEGSGHDLIRTFFGNYERLFIDRPELYRFVKDFDAYAVSAGGIPTNAYSMGIDQFKSAFLNAYERGLADGSVRKIADPELFYFSSAHAMLELCKKLSGGETIVEQDRTTDAAAEIRSLKETFLYYLSASNSDNTKE